MSEWKGRTLIWDCLEIQFNFTFALELSSLKKSVVYLSVLFCTTHVNESLSSQCIWLDMNHKIFLWYRLLTLTCFFSSEMIHLSELCLLDHLEVFVFEPCCLHTIGNPECQKSVKAFTGFSLFAFTLAFFLPHWYQCQMEMTDATQDLIHMGTLTIKVAPIILIF